MWGRNELDHILLKKLSLAENVHVGKLDNPSDHAALTFKLIIDEN